MSIRSHYANRSRPRLQFAAAALVTLVVGMPTMTVAADADSPIELAVRFDDMGMCHSVNAAVRQVIASGIPLSTSLMIACPWYLEAVEILRIGSCADQRQQGHESASRLIHSPIHEVAR